MTLRISLLVMLLSVPGGANQIVQPPQTFQPVAGNRKRKNNQKRQRYQRPHTVLECKCLAPIHVRVAQEASEEFCRYQN